MLKRLAQSAAVALAVGSLPMSAAHASQVCTTGSVTVCVDFSLTGLGGTSFELQVSVITAPVSASLYQFGITSDDPGVTLTSPGNLLVDGSPSGSWAFGCSGLPGVTLCAQGPTGGGGLHQGDFASFTFTANGSDGSFATDMQAHLQNVINGCSAKIGTNTGDFSTVGQNGVGSFNLGDASESCATTTTTPEPASLWLVGTGLIGVAGVGLRRRGRTSTS